MASEKNKSDRLQQYVEGRLSPEEVISLEGELAADPELRRQLQVLRALTQESTADHALLQAARGLIERFVDDLRIRRKTGRQGLLIFDSGLLPQPAGIRPATVDSRRLKYTADGVSLELSVYPASPGSYELIGQVEWYASGQELAVSLQQGKTKLQDTSNPFGVFHFARVPEGAWLLAILDSDGKLVEFSLAL